MRSFIIFIFILVSFLSNQSFAELKPDDAKKVRRAVTDTDTADFIVQYAKRVRFSGKKLISLDISGHDLDSLPKGIGSLADLQSLNLSNNKFSSFPSSIIQFGKLESLSMIGNDLSTIPDNIYLLSELESLTLGANELSTLPESICRLKNLESIKLSDNKIKDIPSCIGNLSNLEVLSLYDNQLTTLPESITRLNKLFMLSLKNNKLTTLPDGMGKLENMRHLNIEDNPITSLPLSLGNMNKLESIGTTFGTEKIYERRRGESPQSFFERCYKFKWRKDTVAAQDSAMTTVSEEAKKTEKASPKESLERRVGREIGSAIVDKLLNNRENGSSDQTQTESAPTGTSTATSKESIVLTLKSKHVSVQSNPIKSNSPIDITYSDLPGTQGDWISFVKSSEPDDTYGDYFYPYGKAAGKYTFSGVPTGLYEIRVYYDWPTGGYTVQDRLKVLVE